MPSTKRFQARPSGRAFERRLLSRNCPFRDEQQPKLRELFFVKSFLVVLFLTDAVRVAELTMDAKRRFFGSSPPPAS